MFFIYSSYLWRKRNLRIMSRMTSLSILIPEYNETCIELVRALSEQAATISSLNYEILVADDCSTLSAVVVQNRQINQIKNCYFLEYPENFGRAALRNNLADQAHYENLLFIDSDAQVYSPTFIRTYVEMAFRAEVVCGGVRNLDHLPSPRVSLRYRYEKAATVVRTVCYRQKHPYHYFTTFNFLIKRELFHTIKFDEHCVEYGYEDALFGVELRERAIQIRHIDNPLVHTGMDFNEIFLEKTEAALRTLNHLGGKMQASAAVSQAVCRIQQFHLLGVFRFAYKLFVPLLRAQLMSSRPSLTLFKLYKLGYYSTLNEKR